MDIYSIVGIIVATLTLGGTIGGGIAYAVRKVDKVKQISEKVTTLDDLQRRLEITEKETATLYKIIDKRQNEIDSLNKKIIAKFNELDEANSIVLEALSGIANQVGADSVHEMLEKKTRRMIRGTI